MTPKEIAHLTELYKNLIDADLLTMLDIRPEEYEEGVYQLLLNEAAARGIDFKAKEAEFSEGESEAMEPLEPLESFVLLQSFRDYKDAAMARSVLESSGIECFLDDEHIVVMDWFYSNAVGGVKLKVRQSDLATAKEILKLD